MLSSVVVDIRCKLLHDKHNPGICRQAWKLISDVNYSIVDSRSKL